jgi:hypothetical protein
MGKILNGVSHYALCSQHGEGMDKIIQQGFNRSFCGKNATAYGRGVYFARDASYSADPTYAVRGANGLQYMMACRVVVGEYCRGQVDAVTPDVRDPKTHALYDSTVGLLGNDTMARPSIYVTYHGEFVLKLKVIPVMKRVAMSRTMAKNPPRPTFAIHLPPFECRCTSVPRVPNYFQGYLKGGKMNVFQLLS